MLRAHQEDMADWMLAHDRCGIWCRMGSGKTLACLHVLATRRDLFGDAVPALVIAPPRVANSTWPGEVAKFHQLGLRCVALRGTREKRRQLLKEPADLYTISLDSLPSLIEDLEGKWPFKTVIFDEATRLRGFRSRQGTKRARIFSKVAWKSRYFIELTATPATNGLHDLWGPMWFLDKGVRLGDSFSAFESRWFKKGYGGFGLKPLPSAKREIPQLCKDICVTIEPPFKIDEPVVTDIVVQLPPTARKLYRQMETDFIAQLREEKTITAVNAAIRSAKCLQLASGFLYDETGATEFVHDAKLDALDSIVEESAGANLLVAYNFREDMERIMRAYPRARLLDTNPKTIDDWNAGKIRMLLLHPMAAGHGISLQDGGNVIVWFGLPWSLEQYLQTIERIGPLRQMQSGYNRPCLVYRIVTEDTVEGVQIARLSENKDLQDLLLDYMRKRK